MALQKSIEAASGITGDYWKITKKILHRLLQKTEIEICVFKDAASSGAGNGSLMCIPKKIFWMDDLSAEGATVADCYAEIMSQAEESDTDDDYFTDAEDV